MSSIPNSQPRPLLKWGICGLLLLATMINYMDRQTLSQMAKRIKVEFANDDNQLYARLETGFALAFGTGLILTGITVDRIGARLLYPLMVSLWSLAGFMTGFVRNYEQLLACRVLLGFFEAANWPCALYTTQKLLTADQRTMGNGILQSGAAIGAIVTPLIVLPFLVEGTEHWRYPFMIIGAVGLGWVVLWLAIVRPGTIPHTVSGSITGNSMREVFADRRFWALAVVVVAINASWQFFRVWLPLLLQEQHGYEPREVAWFTSAYYVSTDFGSLSAGALTLAMIGRGFSVHRSRMSVYFICALLCLLTFAAAMLPRGWLLLVVLLVIGFGMLGLFPNYYSFAQEVSLRHQGKVSGILGSFCWYAQPIFRELEGWSTKHMGYSPAIAAAGIPPMIGFLAMLFIWRSPVVVKKEL
jgi:MFS transporter, ACS family, aldohexuronate transporter